MISVLILTHNEEQDLPGCLDSVQWSDDVHVFDSCSTDHTQEIAHARGASVAERKFDSYSAQRNAALSTLSFRHEWIFILDADERPTPELAEEMLRAVEARPLFSAYKLRRRDFFQERWLKHAQISPFYVRLVRRGRVHYLREVNEVLEVDGAIGELSSPLDHYPFSKGIQHWITKHNVYSTMEAKLLVSGAAVEKASLRAALFEKDFHRRRAAQKAIFYHMPLRPLFKWCYMMFWRGAILDGRPGIAYATLQSFYEYLIELKRHELLYKEKHPSKTV